MKAILFITSLAILSTANAQCIKGDCTNGTGSFNFGYAIYTGSFKNGKPHGAGVMDYGNGEKYEGQFVNGTEEGEGVFYKNGTSKKVQYEKGKIVRETEIVIVGGHMPNVEGCSSGDCLNGSGVMIYPSKNKYSGQFKNGQRHGTGTFTFASGNSFVGKFHQDLPVEGTFNYARESVSFTGKVNEDCTPQTGNYYYPNTEATVTILNGKITKIVNPKADKLKAEMSQMDAAQKPTTCTRCNGKGISGYSRVSVTNTVENVGVDRYLNGRYTTTTRYGSTSFPDICTDCGGKGIKTNK